MDDNQNDDTQTTVAEPEEQKEQAEEQHEQAENAENAAVAEEAEEVSETPSESVSNDQPQPTSTQSQANNNDHGTQAPTDQTSDESESPVETKENEVSSDEENQTEEPKTEETTAAEDAQALEDSSNDDPNAKWYVVHTYSGHENKVATALKQRVESEHLENKILDILVPTQDKIEIRSGKKNTVKEKIFPGYILVKMILDDNSWLAVRTTQGVTGFVGIGNKPTPIPTQEVKSIVRFMTQGAAPTFKDVYMVDDTVKIVDGPFSEFIGKVDSVDKEHGKVRVLVSIFGRETPVELDFLQVQKL